jgi:hypothetical protein
VKAQATLRYSVTSVEVSLMAAVMAATTTEHTSEGMLGGLTVGMATAATPVADSMEAQVATDTDGLLANKALQRTIAHPRCARAGVRR